MYATLIFKKFSWGNKTKSVASFYLAFDHFFMNGTKRYLTSFNLLQFSGCIFLKLLKLKLIFSKIRSYVIRQFIFQEKNPAQLGKERLK